MAADGRRTDGDTLKRLEALRPAYERLRTERIRAEGEIERLARELEEARRLARAEFGTDDEGEIGLMIEAMRAEDAAKVEAFARTLSELDRRLAALEAGA